MTQENNLKLDDLAPIVLFVYNRPDHTKQTVEALQKNELAIDSELFIYSDAAKNENAEQKVNEVRQYIKNINGFKSVTIIEREKNWGLANSIIDGVTKIVNEYGKIIVLEDDLVTSPYFLKFMNEALEFYKDEEKVWHISGWNYPIDISGLGDVFLWRLMNCWGWGTWADRWSHYEKDVDKLISEFVQEQIDYLNLDGINDSWLQVKLNQQGKINTWAIFWYALIIKRDGLCLNPSQSFVENIGHDGSGIHCTESCSFETSLSMNNQVQLKVRKEENKLALEKIKKFYKFQKKFLIVRLINKLSRIIISKNIIK